MWYAILCEDVHTSLAKRAPARAAHVQRLNALKQQGRLLIAGPHPAIDAPAPGPAGYSGSLIIAEFPSLSEAQTWADADPYVTAGVYAKVAVKPLLKTLP